MAIYIGRDELINARNKLTSLTQSDLKGLDAEIKVGDLLAGYLPEDTYLIAHPVIGNYEPDFLVISPQTIGKYYKYQTQGPSTREYDMSLQDEQYSNALIIYNDENELVTFYGIRE